MSAKCQFVLCFMLIFNATVFVGASDNVKLQFTEINQESGENILENRNEFLLDSLEDSRPVEDRFRTSSEFENGPKVFTSASLDVSTLHDLPENNRTPQLNPEQRSGALVRLNEPYFGELGFDVFNEDASSYNWGENNLKYTQFEDIFRV